MQVLTVFYMLNAFSYKKVAYKKIKQHQNGQNIKNFLALARIYISVSIFSLVCYFPPYHQNNKKARKFKKVLRKSQYQNLLKFLRKSSTRSITNFLIKKKSVYLKGKNFCWKKISRICPNSQNQIPFLTPENVIPAKFSKICDSSQNFS